MIKINFSQKASCGLKYILDKTEPFSAPGKRALKTASFFTADEKAELLAELDNVEKMKTAFAERAPELAQIESVFFHLKDLRNTFSRLSGATLDEVEFFELKHFLNLTRQASGLAEALTKNYGLCGIKFKDTSEAFALLKADKGEGFFIDNALSETLRIARAEKEAVNVLMSGAGRAETAAEFKRLHLAAAAAEEAASEKVREKLSQMLRPFADDFIYNSETAGKLDFILAKAKLAYATGAVKPEFYGKKLSIKNMVNPEIKDKLMQRGAGFTPVSIEALKGVTLITGANMGGKSVALKTIALNVLLAHLGFFVYADSARMPVFDFVELINENMQSVDKGLSTFGGEIVKVNTLLKELKSGQTGLALMDEFAGGTNFEEGARIFRAVEKALNKIDVIAVMTTHFDGVACDAGALYQVKGLSGADLIKIESEIASGEDGVELISRYMDYGLVKIEDKNAGVPKDAVVVCRLLKLDEDVLKNI